MAAGAASESRDEEDGEKAAAGRGGGNVQGELRAACLSVCLSVLKSVRVCVWSSFLPWRAIDWLVRQSGSFIICFLPTMQSALDLASQARAEHADAAAAADADAVSCTTMK